MSLTTLSRTAAPEPLRLPVSPGRRKLAEAARLLQQGLTELYQEERTKADARESAWRETEAKAQRRVQLAAARQATANLRIEVDRKWFWSFNNETLDLLRAVAADAKKRGETSDGQMVERHIDGMVEQLERIQKKEAAR
jgi:hypothetical protein